jgi:uncharacterized protein Ymh
MTRRNQQELKGPTISFAEGRRRLQAMRDKGTAMLKNRPLAESAVDTWANTSLDYIQKTFGEGNSHLYTFLGQLRMGVGRSEQEDAEKLQERVRVLDSLLELIDQELSFSAPVPVVSMDDFWGRLHPSVVQVAKDRFSASHYADAVEAAFKELNAKIKAYMKRATGNEFDGADLMQRAFSPNAPVIRLADLSNNDGQDI